MRTTSHGILVVEDDVTTLDSYARSLSLSGFHVWRATSGEEAWHEVQTKRPDALIVDLQLPGIDGLEFLRRLRASEHHQHTPAALVTGNYYVEAAVVDELRTLGVELRFKPLWLEDLDSLLEQMLRQPQTQSAGPVPEVDATTSSTTT